MAGPVKRSPAEMARGETVAVDTVRPVDTVKSLDMTPGPIMTSEEVAQTHHPISLVEKFAQQMGGVEPSKMLKTLKATAFRLPDKYRSGNWTPQEVTNEQMMALLVVANKYGLNPFIKEIYAFPDKGGIVPIVGVDGWSRMINDHVEFDGMKFVNSKEAAVIDDHARRCPDAITCIIYRKDRSHPTEITEYLDEVYRPAFEKDGVAKPGPWQSHTKRMLRHKAMIQCARIAFGFTGIHDQDEAERIVASDYVIVNQEPTQAATLTDRFKKVEDAPPAITHESEAKAGPEEAIEGELDHGKGEKSTEDAPPVCDHVWLMDSETKLGDHVQCRDCPETKIYEPEPEKPKPQGKKAPAKKPNPIKDPSAKFMQRIVVAGNAKEVTDILTEIADFQGMSQPKRMVLKKAAQAKMGDFSDEPE